jgi:hypothetical protein
MKKHVSILAISMLFVIGMVATSCLFSQENDWSLVGTWVNPAYEDSNAISPKSLLTSDGAITMYYHIADSVPEAVGTYAIESDWTEPGLHWFKLKSVYGRWTYFELAKLTDGGNKWESVVSTEAYPASFDPSSKASAYVIRTRQK